MVPGPERLCQLEAHRPPCVSWSTSRWCVLGWRSDTVDSPVRCRQGHATKAVNARAMVIRGCPIMSHKRGFLRRDMSRLMVEVLYD